MTGETLDCYNCGRTNPEWAQVCRSCGVPLRRHGVARSVPEGRIPTDRDSLISMGAVLVVIVAAILFGLFFSSLNPTDPEAGIGGAPTPSPSLVISPIASDTPLPEETEAPTPPPEETAEPALPGTVRFGTGIDANQEVTGETDTFTPGDQFAHSVAVSEPFGVPEIQEGVVRLNEDGTDGEVVVNFENNVLPVDPSATIAGICCVAAENFISAWGPGVYAFRVYIEGELIAEGEFRLAEG
jgi:hypothetical protein